MRPRAATRPEDRCQSTQEQRTKGGKSSGYLFLGHSESIAGFDLPLTVVANTVFQRTATS